MPARAHEPTTRRLDSAGPGVDIEYTLTLTDVDWHELEAAAVQAEQALAGVPLEAFEQTFGLALERATGTPASGYGPSGTASHNFGMATASTVYISLPPPPAGTTDGAKTPAPTLVPTTTLPAPLPGLPQFAEELDEAYSTFLAGNSSEYTTESDEATVVVAGLDFGDDGTEDAVVEVPGTEVAVTVPPDLPNQDPLAALVVVITDEEVLMNASDHTSGEGARMLALVDMQLWSLAKAETVHFECLATPIQILMAAHRPPNPACRYMDTETGLWVEDGVWVVEEEQTAFVCATNHLSIFAAFDLDLSVLWECSNAELLSWKAIKRMREGHWWYTPGAWLVWISFAWHIYLVVMSIRFDAHPEYNSWRDEEFLTDEVTFRNTKSKLDVVFETLYDAYASIMKVFDLTMHAHTPSFVLFSHGMTWVLVHISSILGAARAGVLPSDVHFLQRVVKCRELCMQHEKNRRLAEGVDETMPGPITNDPSDTVTNLATDRMLKDAGTVMLDGSSDARQAGAVDSRNGSFRQLDARETLNPSLELRMGLGDADRLQHLEDSRVLLHPPSYLLHGIVNSMAWCCNRIRRSEPPASVANGNGPYTKRSQRAHEDIIQQFEEMATALWEDHQKFFEDKKSHHVMARAFRVFLALQPWTSLMHSSATMPCTIRALLQMCRVFGSFLGAALYYGSQGIDAEAPEACVPGSFLESLGLDITFGIATSVLAFIPLTLLRALHQRDVTYVGSDKDWHRKLRQWWIKDILLWTFSVVYIGFCVVFCLIFISNVSATDSARWTVCAVMALAKNYILVPMLLAVSGVTLASLAVHLPGICEASRAKLPRLDGEESIATASKLGFIACYTAKYRPGGPEAADDEDAESADVEDVALGPLPALRGAGVGGFSPDLGPDGSERQRGAGGGSAVRGVVRPFPDNGGRSSAPQKPRPAAAAVRAEMRRSALAG